MSNAKWFFTCTDTSGKQQYFTVAAPEKSPHGKRATKKEVNAARAVSTSFFASNFRAAGITRRRCCCRPRRAAGIRRAPCGRRKRP